MTVDISFKAEADGVKNALDTIKIVTPPSVTQDAMAGFLFVVGKKVDQKDGQPGPDDGKDFCWVYSTDALHVARAEFPIFDVQGEGAFAYPAGKIDSFKYARGAVEFTVHSDVDNGVYNVRWAYGDGAFTEEPSIDPRLLNSCDKRLAEATDHNVYRVSVLKEALRCGKAFLASTQDRNAKDEYKIMNIYDAASKGDGTLHSTDGYQRFYFQCDDIKGKGLAIHADHIGVLESFLAKCGPEVVIAAGTSHTYVLSKDGPRTAAQVFGWAKHNKPPLEYKALSKSWDKVVLTVKERPLLIEQVNFMKSSMQKGYDKVKMHYDHSAKQIRFHLHSGGKAKSLPINVDVVQYDLPDMPDGSKGFTSDINADWMLSLFKEVRASEVEFRMFPMEDRGGPKGGAGFRTVDEFLLDSEGKVVGGSGANPDPANGVFQCKVTRFMPSKL